MSLFDQYLATLSSAAIQCIDVFGYSGENDHHINEAIVSNPNIQLIRYYCDPEEVHSEKTAFEIRERFMPPTDKGLELVSWYEVWNVLRKRTK